MEEKGVTRARFALVNLPCTVPHPGVRWYDNPKVLRKSRDLSSGGLFGCMSMGKVSVVTHRNPETWEEASFLENPSTSLVPGG